MVIEAPNTEGRWELIETKDGIERGCIEENVRRFTQANDTPALLPEQIDLLGWNGNTSISQSIIDNGTSHVLLHPDIQLMTPYFQAPDRIKQMGTITTEISDDEFMTGWKKAREFTSSGRSGLHFGHFKASCKSKTARNIDRQLAEISLSYGVSLKRWHQGIDVMIPKKVSSLRIDKLRTIVLVEPDFNFLKKLMGKRMMANAEKAESLAPEQYGSRKKKSAIIHATNKQILFDTTRQKKQSIALVVLDAKSCYDRIAPPIASIAMRRQGIPVSFSITMFDTLTQMKHYVKTAFGESEIFYCSGETKFHGILQGNGAGPAIWAVVSSPILDSLRKNGFGISVIQPSTNLVIQIPAFAFVDDTDLVQDIEEQDDVSELPAKAVAAWQLGLHVTGGALVPEKCNWYALVHRWTNDKWSLASMEEIPGTINLHANLTVDNEISRMPPDKAVAALGVMFAPNGDMTEQVQYLKNKGILWAEQVRCCGLSRNEAWYLLLFVLI